jgi:heme A synthase
MKVREAINRGNNLLALALLGIGGGTFALTIFSESEWIDRIDDAIIGLLAIGIIVWYFWGANRYRRSWVPLAMLLGALAAKLGAVVLELHDPAALGDDIPGVVMFAISAVVFAILYFGFTTQDDQRDEDDAFR